SYPIQTSVCLSYQSAILARSQRRYPTARTAFRAEVCSTHEQEDREHPCGNHECIGELGMAGEREGTGKPCRAFCDSFPRLGSKRSFSRVVAFQRERSRKGNTERYGTRTCCARPREIGGVIREGSVKCKRIFAQDPALKRSSVRVQH